jgi:hypothetical protein
MFPDTVLVSRSSPCYSISKVVIDLEHQAKSCVSHSAETYQMSDVQFRNLYSNDLSSRASNTPASGLPKYDTMQMMTREFAIT